MSRGQGRQKGWVVDKWMEFLDGLVFELFGYPAIGQRRRRYRSILLRLLSLREDRRR